MSLENFLNQDLEFVNINSSAAICVQGLEDLINLGIRWWLDASLLSNARHGNLKFGLVNFSTAVLINFSEYGFGDLHELFVVVNDSVDTEAYRESTAWMATYMAGVLKVSNMIWVIFSLLALGLRGASVRRTGCSSGATRSSL